MNIRDYTSRDATALADLMRKGQVSAAEVQSAARVAIEAVNPRLNALVGDLFDEPLEGSSSGAFAGVPFVVKDLVLHGAGIPMEMGSRLARGLMLPHETVLMAKFRAAGLAILGRTNTPEFGLNASTEPVANGATRNPWDPTRTPGGSSGGSAALVAAGAVPFAHANDGGGSIRIPAANCGLVGLKPTRGRVAVGPDADCPIGGLAIEFAVTRSVRDAAALLDQVQGPAAGELFWLGAPARPYVSELGADPGRLRVRVSSRPASGVPVAAESIEAVNRIARLLATMGHEVEAEDPPVPFEAFNQAIVTYFTAFGAKGINDLAFALDRPISADTLEATTRACYEHAKRLTALDVMAADVNRNMVNRTIGAWFETIDLLVTPTCAEPAWPLGHLDANDGSLDAQGWFDRVFAKVPFTPLFNMTGQPAMSLPLVHSRDGLPIGIQLVARYGAEDVLFRVAHRLEEALPWSGRRPPIHAAA